MLTCYLPGLLQHITNCEINREFTVNSRFISQFVIYLLPLDLEDELASLTPPLPH